MCFGCFQEPVEPPTEKTRSLRDRLKIIFWLQLIIAIFKLIIGFSSNLGGFNGFIEILACFIIYMGYNQLDFSNCMYYVFICIYLGLLDICIVGQRAQGNNPLYPSDARAVDNIAMSIVIISFFFYLVAGYFTFKAYREFKATSIEFGGFSQQGNYQAMAGNRANDSDEEEQRQYYQNYSNNQMAQPSSNLNIFKF